MKVANVNGINLAYEDLGAGEPILFVHGFPLSNRLWQHVIEPMALSNRLILPDLRGMGNSEVTPEASFANYCDDLVALLDHLREPRPVTLVGLSMGGYLAFEFYRLYQSRVRALVLVDTRAEADSDVKKHERREMARRVLQHGSGVVADAMLPVLFGPAASDELKNTWHRIMVSTNPQGVAAALGAMADRADSLETLPRISVPTLVVVGEEDSLTPPSAARVMHRGIPSAKIKVIPDAGHMVPVEQPAAFVRVLTDFVRALPAML